ncbi:MAG: type IX secretion system membrane protein PorP/SprF [Bacteroidetes bacterium]|nr:type IX secretion system membrane protein PorP/SprF [Bacteroidota bacterium]
MSVNKSYGVDPQFSQFYSNSLYLAPSFAGVNHENRISLNARKQWPQIPNGFTTYSFSYDRNFDNLNSGLGFLILNDYAGSGQLGSLNIGVLYSYDFRLSEKWHVRPGVHFLYTERRLQYDKLIWHDQITQDGITNSGGFENSLNHVGDIDFNTSVLTYSDQFWFGLTIDHLLKPNHSLYEHEGSDDNLGHLPVKYSFFGGTKFILKQELLRPTPTSMQIAYLFRKQDQFKQLDFGIYYYRKPLVLGFWYRGIPVVKPAYTSDSFVFLLGYKMNQLSLGYSYDFTVSRLITSTGGSHEISMTYSFTTKIKKKKGKMVPCPEF